MTDRLQKLAKSLYRRRTSILIALLFVLSMGVSIFFAEVSLSSALQLIEESRSLYQVGKFQEAAGMLQQAAGDFAKSGDRLNQAMALSNLSLTYQQLGQWKEARQAIEESRSLLESQPSSPERERILAQTLDIRGQIEREVGQLEASLKTWQQAAAIYTQIGAGNGARQSQINQVLALQDLGLYPRACNTLLAALDLELEDCQKLSELTKSELTDKLQVLTEGTTSSLTVQGLRNLGDLLRVIGQPLPSQIVLETSLKLAQQLQPSPDKNQEIATVYLSLGNTALVQKNAEAALNYYQQAEAESAATALQIQAQLNQLSLLVKRQSWPEVPNLVSKIRSRLNDLPNSRTAIDARLNLAQSLFCWKEPTLSEEERERSSPILKQCISTKEGETENVASTPQSSTIPTWEEIAEILAGAVSQARTLGNQAAEAYALGYLGGAYQQMGKWSEAQKFTQQALDLAPAFEKPEIAYRWQWQLGRLREIQGDEEGAIAAYSAVFATLKSLRGDLTSINREIQFTFRDSVEPVYREYVDLLLRGEKPSQENLKQARESIEALQLAELNDFFQDACLESKPEQIDRVVEGAPSPTAFLYAIILKDRLEVILALSGETELQHYTTQLPQPEIKKTLSDLRNNLSNVTRTAKVQESSQKVYDWLIRPVQERLAENKVTTLVFVLDSWLRNIPMAVLYNAKTDKYLVENYAIALTPGLQLLSPQPLTQVPLNVLTGGVSEEREIDLKYFPKLEYGEQELEIVRSLIPGRRESLLNADFLKSQLQNELNTANFNVVHLSTHGNFSSNPDDTFLLSWDRLLKIKDLENLVQIKRANQSIPIELLVLSACQTAKGDERAVLGMAGVAVRAGARSTLATLWPVYDESTAKFIGLFYEELAKNNNTEIVTKAKALQKVQIEFLKNQEPGKNWSRPYFWAPFILLGNWL